MENYYLEFRIKFVIGFFVGRLVFTLDRGIVCSIRFLTRKRQYSSENWLKISAANFQNTEQDS